MELTTAIIAVNGIFAIAIGFFALWKNPRNTINRTFSLFAFAIALWAAAQVFPLDPKIMELAVFGGITLTAITNLHFMRNLTGGRSWAFVLLSYLAGLALFGLVSAKFFGFLELLPIEFLYAAWIIFFLLTLTVPAFLIFSTSQKLVGAKKYQLRFASWEYLAALIISGITFGVFYDTETPLVANLANTPHLLTGLHLFLVFYFFVEWKFLKLKIIAPNFFKKLFALIITGTVALSFHLFFSLGHFEDMEEIGEIITILIAVLVYNLTVDFFAEQNWFQAASFENFKRKITEFQNQNIFYASTEQLEENINKSFSTEIGIAKAKLVVLNLEGNTADFPELEKHFAKDTNYLVTTEEEYLAQHRHVDCPYLEELKKLGDVCFPLFQNTNELIGFFAIEREEENIIYIEEELKMLERGAHYIALALMGIIYTKKLREQTERLKADYAKLKTLDNAKDAFIANVSHELRTPATALKGYAEMIAAPTFGELNEKQRDFVRRIKHNTDWLLALLKDILEITKLESEQIEFNFEKVEVLKLLKTIAAEWQKPCEDKKLTLDSDFDALDESFTVNTDPRYLQEILERLITNAHKFTEKGGIKFSARISGEFLKIAVQDSGIGISDENLAKVWDKFFQSEDFLEKGDAGTGLGLAIIKKLVENLKGNILVDSRVGQGSTFTVLIPLQHEQ